MVLLFSACVGRKRTQPSPILQSEPPSLTLSDTAAKIPSLLPDSLGKLFGSAQSKKIDSTRLADTIRRDLRSTPDSLSGRDSLLADSLSSLATVDSLKDFPTIVDDPAFAEIVDYQAADSMVMLKSNLIYLFGESSVNFQNKGLQANFMRLNVDSSVVFSRYITDSMGRADHFPIFKDGEMEYQARTMNYNIKTGKGFISGVVTRQGEGYVTATQTKKLEDNTLYMCDGKYSTCDRVDHPHFYIHLTRAKVRPQKNIVTGPAYLVIADVPIYALGLPFGFFPFNSTYSSGILPPSYGEELEKGFYLRNGGYYFAFNDYVDLALTGEIYSKGSWGVSAASQYRKRYKFSGSVDAGYLVTVHGYKFDPQGYQKNKDFHINWSHTQDPKADPNRNFSASVNFSTSSYDRNALSSLYGGGQRYAQNTKSSNVNYRRTFPGTPFSISTSMNVTQRTQDSTIALTLPDMNISMSSIFPFKRKKRVGSERWYEKIKMSYSGSIRNRITTKEDKLLKSDLLRDWQNGASHNIPINATFTLFDYINLTPSVNYNERWYSHKINKAFDPSAGRLSISDTVYGFYRSWDFNTSLSLSTTLYGFFTPWRFLFGDKLSVIRHRLNPTISLSYAPDFSDPFFKAWKQISYPDKEGKLQTEWYSPYEGQSVGVPPRGKQGVISLSFANNIEAKVKSKTDSTGFAKWSIIDDFTWGTSYNMAADSLRWSNINTSLRLKLPGNFNLSLSGAFDPYVYKTVKTPEGGFSYYKSNDLKILNGKGIGSLISTGTAFSYTFNNDTFDKLAKFFSREKKDAAGEENSSEKGGNKNPAGKKDDQKDGEKSSPSGGLLGRKKDVPQQDNSGYVINKFGWNFSVNYSVNYGRAEFDFAREDFKYKLTHNLSFNGMLNPTPGWSFNFHGNYNFDLKRVTNLQFNLTRDMHCWALTAGFIPIGFNKSYNITIAVKSSLLQDLKWQQSSSPLRGSNWR